MAELEELQAEYSANSQQGKKIADRYHKRWQDNSADFDAIFAEIWKLEPREENAQNPFASTAEITAKAIQAAGFEGDSEIAAAFHQHEADYYEYTKLDKKGLEMGFKIADLTLKAESKKKPAPSPNEWLFAPIHIVAPKPIMDEVITPMIEREAVEGKGLFANVSEIAEEDEEEDILLPVKVYNCDASFTAYIDELKQYGVIGRGKQSAFLDVTFKHFLFECLQEAATFIKDNTDKPAAAKNRLNEILTAFDGLPIWGLFFQILILQGLCRWLECVNINEGDNGYNEAQSLYEWMCEILADKEWGFCHVPYGDKDKERLKPICVYMINTEVGKMVQQFIRKEYYSEPQQEPNKGVVAAFTLPTELDTTEARGLFQKAIEAGLMSKTDSGYKWEGTAALFGFFADKVSDHLNIRPYNGNIPWRLFKAAFVDVDDTFINTARQKVNDYKNKGLSEPEGFLEINKLLK